jgi:hypothetical protein
MVEQIKAAVLGARGEKQMVAMFHYQVLKNADELRGVDPVKFCKELGISDRYASEFRKMLALARLMKDQGTSIVSN